MDGLVDHYYGNYCCGENNEVHFTTSPDGMICCPRMQHEEGQYYDEDDEIIHFHFFQDTICSLKILEGRFIDQDDLSDCSMRIKGKI